jgi:hypothetical protein
MVVERTFAWRSQHRRRSKNYERLCATSEAWTYVAMIVSCFAVSLASEGVFKQFLKHSSRRLVFKSRGRRTCDRGAREFETPS